MEQNYEESIKRLEEITALLEEGKLSIDESLIIKNITVNIIP